MFNLLQSTNQELFERTSVIKVATTKCTNNFHYAKEAIMYYHQIDTFTVGKDKWNTKEDTGKSIKNA